MSNKLLNAINKLKKASLELKKTRIKQNLAKKKLRALKNCIVLDWLKEYQNVEKDTELASLMKITKQKLWIMRQGTTDLSKEIKEIYNRENKENNILTVLK